MEVWKITNIFLTPVLKARVFTFQHQVVEFKIYVMPFFFRKVNLYFSSIELVLSAYQIFIFFVIFLNIIVNIIEFVNQSDNNIKIKYNDNKPTLLKNNLNKVFRKVISIFIALIKLS